MNREGVIIPSFPDWKRLHTGAEGGKEEGVGLGLGMKGGGRLVREGKRK